MIGFLFFFFGVLSVLGMCGLAAWTDYKGFKIPNIVSIVIVASFIVAFGVTAMTGQSDLAFISLKPHLIAFASVFVVTGILFALKVLGAGDAKMMSAVSLWLGVGGLVPFLFYMSVAGGLLALVSIILKKYKPLKSPPPGTWLQNAQLGANKVPYGIAIGFGTLIAFFLLGYFSPEKWAVMVNL